jgi:hypothetical protein
VYTSSSSPLRKQTPDIPEASRMSRENLLKAVKALKSEGDLQIVDSSGNGFSVAFKRIGLIDQLRVWFLSPKQKEQMALQAGNAIKNALGITDDKHWLLDDIKKEIQVRGTIKGTRIAEKLIAGMSDLKESSSPGYYHATASGAELGLAYPGADQVIADYKVMEFDDAWPEAERRLESRIPTDLQEWEKDLAFRNNHNEELGRLFSQSDQDLQLVEIDGYGSILRLPSANNGSSLTTEPEALIVAIAKKCDYSGSVVMYPRPALVDTSDSSGGQKWALTNEVLKKQLRAAQEANQAAQAKGKAFKITFVGLDAELMRRMRQLQIDVNAEYDRQRSEVRPSVPVGQ